MYRINKTSSSILAIVLLSLTSNALAESSLDASFRFGFGFLDNDTVNNDFSIQSDESRIRWTNRTEINSNLNAIANLTLEIEPDNIDEGSSGIGIARQAWVGVEGGFGTMTIGTQYSAFYDTVSSKTDIAWFGSCLTQLICERAPNVFKYSGANGPLQYTSSIQATGEDEGNDIADQIELGASFDAGALSLGFSTAISAGEGNRSGGILLGGVASASFNVIDLALGIQFADSDFTGLIDNSTQATLSASFGNFYTVLNIANGLRGDAGNYNTLGYTRKINKNSLMYFEVILFDGGDISGTNTILLAAYKYDFGIL